jgi:hypothetical protein
VGEVIWRRGYCHSRMRASTVSYDRSTLKNMGAAHPIVVTGLPELQMQVDQPSGEIIRSRAIEVFGSEAKADTWLRRPRKIFNDRSPDEIVSSGDIDMMRAVLKSLMSIEFGTFS